MKKNPKKTKQYIKNNVPKTELNNTRLRLKRDLFLNGNSTNFQVIKDNRNTKGINAKKLKELGCSTEYALKYAKIG